MTARQLLALNGDLGRDAPIVRVVRRLHEELTRAGARYCIVGGLAVVRNGAPRTTHDIDVLVDRDGWAAARRDATGFDLGEDAGVDRATGVPIDALFPGDEGGMAIPLPDPDSVGEYDEELGADFARLDALVAIKTAVYMKKRAEDGAELAAKDLADVVSLLQIQDVDRARRIIESAPPEVRTELDRIARRVAASRDRRR